MSWLITWQNNLFVFFHFELGFYGSLLILFAIDVLQYCTQLTRHFMTRSNTFHLQTQHNWIMHCLQYATLSRWGCAGAVDKERVDRFLCKLHWAGYSHKVNNIDDLIRPVEEKL